MTTFKVATWNLENLFLRLDQYGLPTVAITDSKLGLLSKLSG
jgi:hypothetical protein